MIVKLKKLTEKNYEVFANEKFIGVLNIKTINKLNIKDGLDYDVEYIKKIKLIAKLKEARKKAVSILKYKDYSEKELYIKLTKHYSKQISKYIVLHMKKKGYVDDLKYAKHLAKKIIFTKNKGANFVISTLIKKGINKNIAEKTVDSLNCDFIFEIKKLILKKYKPDLQDIYSKKKLYTKLLRRGYRYSDIHLAINNILTEN